MDKQLITTGDVAKICKVKPQTVDYWRKVGKLPFTKKGRMFLFNSADVDEIVKKNNEFLDKKREHLEKGIVCKHCGEKTKYTGYKVFVSNHLVKIHNISGKEYYDNYLMVNKENICKKCGNEKGFISITKGYHKYCNNLFCRMNDESIKNTIKETKLQKYGNENFVNIEKAKLTKIEKYGDSNFTNREKFKKTWSEKPKEEKLAILDKSRNTKFSKYGNINYVNSEKISDSQIERYSAYIKDEFSKHKLKVIEHKNCGTNYICNICGNQEWQSTKFIYSRFAVNSSPCSICKPKMAPFSSQETEIYNFIRSIYDSDVIRNNRDIIDGEIDIFLPDKKLAIEFNGVFWHSSEYKNAKYHYNKTNLCKENGIRLLHIFEDEWIHKQDIIKDKIKNILGKTDNKIFARKCDIGEVGDVYLQKQFYNKNHIQGWCSSSISYGLFYNKTLVALMSFSKATKSKKYEWELVRYATILNSVVVGGASRLLSNFIKDKLPTNIVSYADNSFSNGNMYEVLGFRNDGISSPSYFYVEKCNLMRRHRFAFRKSELQKKNMINEGETEEEAIFRCGKYYKIYDCGKIRYIWEKPNANSI